MRLFFYGTLLAGSDNAVAQEVHRLLAPVGPARVAGSLIAIPDPRGWYPALLPGDGEAHGWLYESRACFGPADVARLDAYEDYDPTDPGASLYVRRAVALFGGGLAEAYFWNRPLPCGARPIPGGDFRGWLAEHGLEPFRGLRDY
jgi:gamma-glutamylcyclotransferase (GGCT)/AIG2-like uncharacterized protein YtfP